ncbi:MAG: bifunctional UDP-N-acetylmuramoyl-tripeptide:D-alanyl-D-alanine ligase/alanine racemase [Chitinophagaceae bacterium]
MPQYTIQEISNAINCEATITSNAIIEHLAIDSRKIVWQKSTLFFAIKTTTNNGHNYINDLYENGVYNFVVEESINYKLYPKANFLLVQSTLLALQQLATFHRNKFTIPVIGITGSNGKTIVKEWLYQLLQEDYNIVRSPKSFNSQIGVPLSVWQLSEQHNLAIFEVGISQTNEMEALQKIVQPTIGVFTHLGDAHQSGFKNESQKLEEKFKLFVQTQTVVANLNNELSFNNSIINCSIQKATIFKENNQSKVSINLNDVAYEFITPFTDEASIQNCITCCATMLSFGYSATTINNRIQHLQHLHMRLQLQNAINNCVIVNDTYTNDFSAFVSGLDFLQQNKANKKTVVILSDFIETNINKQQLFEQLTAVIAANKIDYFVGVGNDMMAYEHLLKYSATEVLCFKDVKHLLASSFIHQLKNQIIYVKGARVFALEKIVQQLQQKNHQTQLQINLNALQHNFKTIKQTLLPTTKIMAMVKAFAYGSGSEEVAKLLQFNRVDYVAVAYTDEGVALRKAGISLPIMVMNIDEANFYDLVEYNLEPEIFSAQLLRQFLEYINQEGLQQFPIHIKVNTGMNRLGFEVAEVQTICSLCKQTNTLKIKSVFTHLACSDDALQDDFTLYQKQRFDEFCNSLQQQLNYSFLQHISNTAAILRLPNLQYNMVRLGIGLYGIQNTNSNLPLQTVATLTTTIAQIRQVKKGESVGYNRKTIMQQDSKIATIRIGYADGLSRQLGNNKGSVWIKNTLAPIVGNVCMDMTMIDVTHINDVQTGDVVEIFGNNLPITEVAKNCNTIAYETLSTLNQRVKRVYVEE